jgi:hypothetical protein
VLTDVQGIVVTKTASVGADNSTANVLHVYLYLNYVRSAQNVIPHDVILNKISSGMILSE